jgi:hypothetical protein
MKKYFTILGSLQAFTALGAIPAGIGYLLDLTVRLSAASFPCYRTGRQICRMENIKEQSENLIYLS